MASPDEPASFEQLEALRNVQLVAANEYPLAHVTRAQLRRREDSDDEGSACLCAPPPRFAGEESEDEDEPRCDDVSCLNFATYVECNDGCPAGRHCRNQRLQHPERFPKLEPFLTERKGYGVRTREDVAQGGVVGEYVGEIIDQRELARRLKLVPRHELNFYYLLLMPGTYIDARNKGSFTRFVNHSCEPNCKTEKWTVHGETRIAVVALRDIQKGEELTFDYQWKALGSRQIKCYCGTPTCKGVIGTEGDVVKDDLSKVYFREPTIEEIGSALVDRRIRVFKSSDDKTVYSVALVKSYDEEKDLYEVEHEILSANSDPTAEMESTIQLKDDSWQVYCETDGMSEDQMKKEIFSIPKRRVSDFQGTSSVESSPLPPTSTPSPTSNIGSTSNSLSVSPNESAEQELDPTAPRRREYVITNQLLVKNIPHKFDENSLRRLFEERGSDGTPTSDLVSVDMFFFEDRTGWALIEMKTPAAAVASKKKLNNRPLGGNTLRVFTAGPKELESFRRGKTKVMYLQREGKIHTSETTTTQESDEANEAESVAEPLGSYPYGRRLNWVVSTKDAAESPSQAAGISAALEESLRTKFVKAILHLAKRLHLDRGDATSAIIALHRYFTFHPMSVNVETFAAAMLNFYLKAHCRKVEWKDYVNEVYNEKYGTSQDGENTSVLPPDSDQFRAIERQLVAAENELLEGLCFDVSGEYPYLLLEKLTTAKKKKLAPTLTLPPVEVQREAKHLIAETLRLRIWTHLPVECVVLSVVYLGAAAVEGVKFLSTLSPKLENLPETPSYLPMLDPNSQEHAMLLECATSLCSSLQDRWVRLAKNTKPAKQAKSSSSAEFDTERFAVSHEKRVSLKEVIRRLLDAWTSSNTLPVASPIISYSDQNSAEFVTFAQLRGITSSAQNADAEVVLATSVFKKEMASRVSGGGPSGSAGKQLAPTVDRLRTNDIAEVESIRKLTYLGSVSTEVKCDLAGRKIYLQPWPYREEESTFSETRGIVSAATRELSSAVSLHAMLPEKFVKLEGIVFPEERKELNADEDDDMVGLLSASATSIAASGSSGVVLDRLNNKKHYLSFEQPLHIYSGIFEAKVSLPLRLRKKVIFDMLTALVSLHDRAFVHRFVAASHLFVYKHGAKLGGYHSVRRTSNVSKDKENVQGSTSNAYTMRESERKEHCYGSWLYVAAPEVLLGETQYTWRADMWSAGCVVLSILLDRVPFLQGQDVRVQLDLIFRLCGTPKSSWPEGTTLRLYRSFKPKHDFRMRLRKTMLEQREKFPEFPEDGIDVLEALLQLDPNKRLSAKKVLELPFFNEIREEEARASCSSDPAFDFSGLPETFPMQKKKLVQHLHAKRRHPSSSSSSARVKPGKSSHDNNHSRSSSSSRHRSKRALSMDKSSIDSAERGSRRVKKRGKDASGDVDMDGADDVPLPASFQFSSLSVQEDSSSGSGGERSQVKSERREKLGWGMGLSSSKE